LLRPAAAALTALALAAACLRPGAAAAWGGRTHEIINRRAAESLRGPEGDAWRPLARSLGAHASDADDRKRRDPSEPPRHYLDADAFDAPPFDDIPHTLEALVRKYGATEAKSYGLAPWAIDECYRMLVLSLRRGDWSSAGAWAADLGHYVADTHQPLHCTLNYDGQRTGNDGVHIRFEVHMMDRYFREESLPAAGASDLSGDDVAGACLAWMADAHAGLDALLTAETAARGRDPSFGDAYYDALWEGTREVAHRQVAAAVRDLAGLYRAAWTQAGGPPGPGEAPPFRALPVASLEEPSGRRRGLSYKALGVAAAALAGALVAGAL
jgi:hypothetical protein